MPRGKIRQVRFADRRQAGALLAERLSHYAGRDDVLVFALPRGGVPVGYEVARYLNAPLDVCVVRKLGVPGQEELAMGAIASGGTLVLNESIIEALNIPRRTIESVEARERRELEWRENEFRGELPVADVQGKIVVLVDDGIATGSTMKSAVESLRGRSPSRIVVATPVAPATVDSDFQEIADEIVCLIKPEPFHAVGLWYEDFTPTTDPEVRDLLNRARAGDQAEAT